MTRTMIKHVSPLLMLTLILAPSLPAQADSWEEYTFPQENTFTLPEEALLSIQNTNGDIDIQGHERKDVVVRATKRVKAGSREEAEEWSEKVNISIDQREKGLFIEVRMPQGWSGSLGSLLTRIFERKPSVRVDFEILSPPWVEVSAASVSGDIFISSMGRHVLVEVVSGDIEIMDVDANVSIDAVSGDIDLENIAGDVVIDAVSSDIEMADVDGNVTIDLTSGDVVGSGVGGACTIDGTSGDMTLKDVHGDVRIDVTSGDIEVQQRRGDLWIDTSSGDVSVETVVQKDGRYRVDTASGQVTFRIPATSSCTVDLETSGGTIQAKLPMVIESVSRTRLRGTMEAGDAQIILSTSGGDIDLVPLD